MSAILIFGENSYLVKHEIQAILREFKKQEGDLNLSLFEANEASEEEIISACETSPFLGSKRLILVNNLDFKKSYPLLAQFVEKIPTHCILVLAARDADKRNKLWKSLVEFGKTKEFTNLKPGEFKKWLLEEAEKQKICFEPAALDLLATYTLGDCASAINEIAKLRIYADGKKITRQDVMALTHPNLHTSVFNLTDAIGARRIESALANIHDIVSRGENLMQIFFMVVRQFRILLNLHALNSQKLSQFQIAQQLKLHPFVVQNSLKQMRNFSEQELLQAHRRLLAIDIGIKTGKVNYSSANPQEFALELEKFIISFA